MHADAQRSRLGKRDRSDAEPARAAEQLPSVVFPGTAMPPQYGYVVDGMPCINGSLNAFAGYRPSPIHHAVTIPLQSAVHFPIDVHLKPEPQAVAAVAPAAPPAKEPAVVYGCLHKNDLVRIAIQNMGFTPTHRRALLKLAAEQLTKRFPDSPRRREIVLELKVRRLLCVPVRFVLHRSVLCSGCRNPC